jgi:hypothetical protein
MFLYYDRDGEVISNTKWALLFEDVEYKRVALTSISDDEEVSTVWLGLDHRFADEGPPLIFETMVFGGPLDQEQERYTNEIAALAGHDRWVAAAREAHVRG